MLQMSLILKPEPFRKRVAVQSDIINTARALQTRDAEKAKDIDDYIRQVKEKKTWNGSVRTIKPPGKDIVAELDVLMEKYKDEDGWLREPVDSIKLRGFAQGKTIPCHCKQQLEIEP